MGLVLPSAAMRLIYQRGRSWAHFVLDAKTEDERNTIACLTGQSGTGKTVLAEALAGILGKDIFVAANIAALPEDLFDSEMFGHLKGSFTGAFGDHDGLVAQARGGVLFLDEIGALSMRAQIKLLRFLDTRRYRPVGAGAEQVADCIIIVATCEDLRAMVADGTFREDLYQRIAGYLIEMSPICERAEDVRRLVTDHLAGGRPVEEAAVDLLAEHPWGRGNFRALKRVVRQLLIDHGKVTELETREALAGLESSSMPLDTQAESVALGPEERCWWALHLCKQNGYVTTGALMRVTCASRSACQRTLNDLCRGDEKKLRQVGSGRSQRYEKSV